MVSIVNEVQWHAIWLISCSFLNIISRSASFLSPFAWSCCDLRLICYIRNIQNDLSKDVPSFVDSAFNFVHDVSSITNMFVFSWSVRATFVSFEKRTKFFFRPECGLVQENRECKNLLYFLCSSHLLLMICSWKNGF